MEIKQFVYQQPEVDKKIPIENVGLIHKLGVQALPGTIIQLNGRGNIVIGQHGNFQLDLGENFIESIVITPKIKHLIIVDLLCDNIGGTTT